MKKITYEEYMNLKKGDIIGKLTDNSYIEKIIFKLTEDVQNNFIPTKIYIFYYRQYTSYSYWKFDKNHYNTDEVWYKFTEDEVNEFLICNTL
jgi:hypothetical protein